MKTFFQLIRIKHWIKNLLIFIPMIAAKVINYGDVIKTFIAFVSFCLMTSSIYIMNDICDIENDKHQPNKRNRPLPSGKVSKGTAIIISILLFLLSLLLNYAIFSKFFAPSLVYLLIYALINACYSFGMKNVAIVDVMLLSLGFIIRLYYGASIINVDISVWLFLTVLNASLFLVLGKRKKELVYFKKSRKVLEYYNKDFLDKFQYLTLALTLVFYSLWTTMQTNKYMFLSIPFVIIIFMKYSLDVEKNEDGDPTTIIYKDKLLFFLCTVYIVLMAYLIGG